ncbi:alpha-amylase family glycosyl hydrolase [Silvimonas iriomotensis]|uniref:Alpha-amylase n=1 Tax=Silvimonas iriomotensis TaxID=449662 RepID=A0ABQ2PBD0_9NEIS|nr:alpha-amylase family glycosyl hydrolase [Silvimonas iriomotensis]GGP22772.1 alpha-amylase [Silvimonas iriomotensis]
MTSSRSLLSVAGLTALLLGQSLPAAEPPAGADISPVKPQIHDSGLADHWAQQGVFMEILVRAYQDSNGDGIGDLNGLTQRLDYLKSLGITGIWLLPIYRSADHDHGYAVADYRDIEPDYGTLADFDRLIAEAHKRGIGVILDYVINHSADTHPLFMAANQDAASPWRNWYVWKNSKPTGWQTYGGDPWYAGKAGGYYYGAFAPSMPDFNFRNPDVLAFHLDNLRFWLNRGVDGFRFDAVGALVENGPNAWEGQPENHNIMRQVHDLLNRYGKRYMVAEAPAYPAEFSGSDSAGSAFAFGLQNAILKSVQMGRVMDTLPAYLKQKPVASMGTFLSNHDSFAGPRVAQQLGEDLPSQQLAAATLLTLPGIPFLYYGEEIGQTFSEPVKWDDQRLRGPMSWDDSANAGFSTAKPFRTLAQNHATANVAAENGKPGSLLETYRALIALRKAQPALQTGALRILSDDDDPVFVFVREQGKTQILVALNYSRRAADAALPAAWQGQWQLLYTNAKPGNVQLKSDKINLAAQQAAIFIKTAP